MGSLGISLSAHKFGQFHTFWTTYLFVKYIRQTKVSSKMKVKVFEDVEYFFFYICYNPRGGVRTVFIWTISHHIVPSHGSYDPSRIEYDR